MKNNAKRLDIESDLIELESALNSLELIAMLANREIAVANQLNQPTGVLPDCINSILYLCGEANAALEKAYSCFEQSLRDQHAS